MMEVPQETIPGSDTIRLMMALISYEMIARAPSMGSLSGNVSLSQEIDEKRSGNQVRINYRTSIGW